MTVRLLFWAFLVAKVFTLPTNVLLRVQKSFETQLRDVYVPEILANADHIKARDCQQQGSTLLIDWRWKLTDIKGEIGTLKPSSFQFTQNDNPNSLSVELIGGTFKMSANSLIEVDGLETRGPIALTAQIKKIEVTVTPTTREREDGLLVPDVRIDRLYIDFDPEEDLQLEADLDLIPQFLSDMILEFIKDDQSDRIIRDIQKSLHKSITRFFDKIYKKTQLIQPLPETNLLVAYSMAGPIRFHPDFTTFPLFLRIYPRDQPVEKAPFEPRALDQRPPLNEAEIEISEHLLDSFLYDCSLSQECYYEIDNTSFKSHSLTTQNLAILIPEPFSHFNNTDLKIKIGLVPGSISKVQFEDTFLAADVKIRMDFLFANETQPLYILELSTSLDASLISEPGDQGHLMWLRGKLHSLSITQIVVLESKVGELNLSDFEIIAEGALVLVKGIINEELLKNAYPLKKQSLGLIQLVSGSLALGQDYLAITGAFQ